ncbi:hypothetical protein M758_UG149600 [Ceratodon purpureus]|nr:hypothetical protein M758_UG149600 [Ceratodon purpureus]
MTIAKTCASTLKSRAPRQQKGQTKVSISIPTSTAVDNFYSGIYFVSLLENMLWVSEDAESDGLDGPSLLPPCTLEWTWMGRPRRGERECGFVGYEAEEVVTVMSEEGCTSDGRQGQCPRRTTGDGGQSDAD